MNLVVDFGNSSVKAALYQREKELVVHLFPYTEIANFYVFIQEYQKNIQHVIISSVVEHHQDILSELDSKSTFILLDEKTPIPIYNRYNTPETLGKDRIAAAVGGAFLFPSQPLLIIDAGTTITYEYVSAQREYLGGSISLGLSMRFKALHTFTKKLPLIACQDSTEVYGTDTESAIRTGVINGVIHEIEKTIALAIEQQSNTKVILCGGDAFFFDKKLKSSIFVHSNLVLLGLNQILEFNKKGHNK